MFPLILKSLLFANFISVITALKMSPVIDAFEVVSLPAAKQRIFNNSIQNLPIFRVTS